jgi:hypothetical protein
MKLKNLFSRIYFGALLGLGISLIATIAHINLISCPATPPPCTEGLGVGMEFAFFVPLGFILGLIGGIIIHVLNVSLTWKMENFLLVVAVPLYFLMIELILCLLY